MDEISLYLISLYLILLHLILLPLISLYPSLKPLTSQLPGYHSKDKKARFGRGSREKSCFPPAPGNQPHYPDLSGELSNAARTRCSSK